MFRLQIADLNLLHSSPAVVQVPSLAREVQGNNFMAQHRSLKGASALGAKRNVLKRFERVEILKRRGQWKEGDRVVGLRKTKPDA
jgi:small basic protein (TIGR04137 family)